MKLEDFHKTKGSEEHNCYDAQVTVTETLKHPPRSETHGQMTLFLPQAESVLGDWKKRQCLLLVALESFAPANTTVIELTPEKMEVMTADFVLLRKSDAVLKAARQAARRQPVGVMRVHTFGLRVPRELVTGTKWEQSYGDGGGLILNVPVDQRLKKRAKSYLRGEENTFKHYEGKEAMRYFKTGQSTP